MQLSPALSAVLPVLRCPVCEGPLRAGPQQVRCTSGHAYDLARQGYLNLATGRRGPGTGDSVEMVAARGRFLDADHFQPIATALAGVVHEVLGEVPGPIADGGGGTGYYLARVLEEHPDRYGVCLDLSVPALRKATRAHPRLAAIGCDVWQGLPLRDGSIAALLSVFAPRNGDEAARCLQPGGVLVTVTPGPEHLQEVIGELGMIGIAPDKQERLHNQLGGFSEVAQSLVRYRAQLPRDDLSELVLMGPSARHLERDELTIRLKRRPEPIEVTVAVRVQAFRAVIGR